MDSAKLDARIADGATCVREDLPVVLDPWDDPFFDETLRQWAERVLTPNRQQRAGGDRRRRPPAQGLIGRRDV
jgi:hypothetical protein